MYKPPPILPRVLYLDLNMRFIDPTRQTLPLVYKSACNTVFYGPGYVNTETMGRGLECYVEKTGPFDFIVGNELLIFCPEFPELGKRNYHKAFSDSTFKYWKAMNSYFFKADCKKIVNLLESDFYNFRPVQREILEKLDAWFLSYNHQNILPLRDMKFIKRERFAAFANDNFYSVVQLKPDAFIPLITCMAETEFWWAPIAERRKEWFAPGAAYFARKEARKHLKIEVRRMRWPNIMEIYSAMSRLNFKPFTNRILLQNYNLIFNKSLEDTKFVYTCGSGLGYPLRKFFEIPAHGCVLVCMPFAGFEDFGFKDWTNCIVAMPDDLMETDSFLQTNPEMAQSIAEKGRELIWNKHRLAVRGSQLKNTLQAIKDGEFIRALWQDGEFKIVKREPPIET